MAVVNDDPSSLYAQRNVSWDELRKKAQISSANDKEKGTAMILQGSALMLFGLLFLIFGLALAFFRATVSKGHREWMRMIFGRRGLEAAEAMSEGTWLAMGTLTAIAGAGFLFAGVNLLLRH